MLLKAWLRQSAALCRRSTSPFNIKTALFSTSRCRLGSSESGNFLSVLQQRPVVGDGSYVFTLEKRGYVMAGPFTPEAAIEYPEAVLGLHREYLRAGADVLQAFTFYSTEGKLRLNSGKDFTSEEINQAACDLLQQLEQEGHSFFKCGGVSPTPSYSFGKGKEAVMEEFRRQTRIFVKNKMDFLLGEFFGNVEEAEWAISSMKETGLPVACTMRVGPTGDLDQVPVGECAIRMAEAGADLVGVNCQYDPFISVEVMRTMKEALDKAGKSTILMMQPLGFHCPDAKHSKGGYHDLKEYPFALEPRLITRRDVREFVRLAYDAGVRYIGGCCGFESYHIREIAYELKKERGFEMPGNDKAGNWGSTLGRAWFDTLKKKDNKEYWTSFKPGTGRPLAAEHIPEDSKTGSGWS